MMPFQREGVRFALAHGGRVLIGDEMGAALWRSHSVEAGASKCCGSQAGGGAVAHGGRTQSVMSPGFRHQHRILVGFKLKFCARFAVSGNFKAII